MSRLGGGSSGFSLASFSISSNFLLSTSWCTLWSATDFLKASSRRSASVLKRLTAASMSEKVAGFSCALCRMTAEVAGSMCNSPWQHGQITVMRAGFAIPNLWYQGTLIGNRRIRYDFGIQEVHHARQRAGPGDWRHHRRRVWQDRDFPGRGRPDAGDRAGGGQNGFFEFLR